MMLCAIVAIVIVAFMFLPTGRYKQRIPGPRPVWEWIAILFLRAIRKVTLGVECNGCGGPAGGAHDCDQCVAYTGSKPKIRWEIWRKAVRWDVRISCRAYFRDMRRLYGDDWKAGMRNRARRHV